MVVKAGNATGMRAIVPTETEEERIRRVARELADSVCPPRAC